MHYRKKGLIDAMIEKAVREQIEHIAFRFPDYRSTLSSCISILSDGVADRITGDIGRTKRFLALCKVQKPRS